MRKSIDRYVNARQQKMEYEVKNNIKQDFVEEWEYQKSPFDMIE